MDEWLINFARNFLDSQKCVFALSCLHGDYFVRYELLRITLHLRLSWLQETAPGQYMYSCDVSYVLIHHSVNSAFCLLPLANQSTVKSNIVCD